MVHDQGPGWYPGQLHLRPAGDTGVWDQFMAVNESIIGNNVDQVKIRQLEELLKRVDVKLHNHIVGHDVQYLQFSFRYREFKEA